MWIKEDKFNDSIADWRTTPYCIHSVVAHITASNDDAFKARSTDPLYNKLQATVKILLSKQNDRNRLANDETTIKYMTVPRNASL